MRNALLIATFAFAVYGMVEPDDATDVLRLVGAALITMIRVG